MFRQQQQQQHRQPVSSRGLFEQRVHDVAPPVAIKRHCMQDPRISGDFRGDVQSQNAFCNIVTAVASRAIMQQQVAEMFGGSPNQTKEGGVVVRGGRPVAIRPISAGNNTAGNAARLEGPTEPNGDFLCETQADGTTTLCEKDGSDCKMYSLHRCGDTVRKGGVKYTAHSQDGDLELDTVTFDKGFDPKTQRVYTGLKLTADAKSGTVSAKELWTCNSSSEAKVNLCSDANGCKTYHVRRCTRGSGRGGGEVRFEATKKYYNADKGVDVAMSTPVTIKGRDNFTALNEGDKVEHPQLGEGVIKNVHHGSY